MAKEKVNDLKISKKKPSFPITKDLQSYLSEYKREIRIPVFYEDLLRFQGSVSVYDKEGNDTLWIRVYYSDYEREEIDLSLKKVYTNLHSDGNEKIISFLNIDAIDYCTFGNSKPFRVKVRNILNDNYTYFYVKKADASRVYGLELEHMLSPYNLNFMVFKDTLIEEHISGIPGDEFIKNMLPDCNELERSQIAKEFVKFNERCMIRLLGDMRSYNFVIDMTPDFDQIQYRIRTIDFDQQSYEGRMRFYLPQFFRENINYVNMALDELSVESIEQYQAEERALSAKRISLASYQYKELIAVMLEDKISTPEKIEQLASELAEFHSSEDFLKASSMGDLVRMNINHTLHLDF